MQAIMFLDIVKRTGGLGRLLERLPGFDREVRTVDTDGNPAGIIRGLGSRKSGRITEGVLLYGDRGTVLVKPLKRGTGIRIMAEAVSTEIAAELCDDMEKLLQKKDRA